MGHWPITVILTILLVEGVLYAYAPSHGRHIMKQPTLTPTSKVTAAGIGGAIAVLFIWILGLFGVDVSGEVAAALTTLASFAAGWLKLENRA